MEESQKKQKGKCLKANPSREVTPKYQVTLNGGLAELGLESPEVTFSGCKCHTRLAVIDMIKLYIIKCISSVYFWLRRNVMHGNAGIREILLEQGG